jgi:SAM-dependent methyltransferase
MSHKKITVDGDTGPLIDAGKKYLFSVLYDLAFSWDVDPELNMISLIWESLSDKTPEKVCEIGAGTGRFTIPLSKKSVSCVAFEPDEGMFAILQNKMNELNPMALKGVQLKNKRFGEYDGSAKFDCILMMTDTLSYIWPPKTLPYLLMDIRSALKKGGILILDIALWGKNSSNTRIETWTEEFLNFKVYAKCKSKLIFDDYNNFSKYIRVENLSFSYKSVTNNFSVCQVHIMNGFTFQDIENLLEKTGLSMEVTFLPDSKEIVEPESRYYPRVILGCKKS